MKTRAEAAAFIAAQLNKGGGPTIAGREKGGQHHYGQQELRELMDFIFGGPPTDKREEIGGFRPTWGSKEGQE